MLRIFLLLLMLPSIAVSQINVNYGKNTSKDRYFEIATNDQVATIYYDKEDSKLSAISANLLAEDIQRISGKKPIITNSLDQINGNLIIIGSLGKCALIDQLAVQHKELTSIEGNWERFVLKTLDQPFKNIKNALVIAGSDRRGAAYGVFSLSEALGVSPWYWWADVPPKKSAQLSIEDLTYISETPSVKYRGIFINDEAPALRNWAAEKFGGFNHQFYEKVFELLLRNKGNYLWPAMWQPSAFADDDPLNPERANDYGIVISTSHHEPMMRAHDEWERFGGGAWNYETNKEQLQAFWRGGIERMSDYESVVTVGMRGDGDEAMSEHAAVDLMKSIITDQRKILSEVTGKPAAATPQVWAIYKEVQEYYDKGMRVDDDILILFCDDNWGNVRILPKREDQDYTGGFGMYYHFDYVGGPVSYRWQNVTQIERVWEQMNLSYEWGIKDLWIVNVGDIKPMEFPISFFLDMAWDVDAFKADNLPEYYVKWAGQQFGNEHAKEIGDLLSLYTKYNARRTPEMLKPDTYHIENYREADRVVNEYNKLLARSTKIYQQLPESYRSAYYQLVQSPIEMCANLNKMYVAAGKNKYYSERGAASANFYADQVKELFEKDADLTAHYHNELENGKWNHMMSQTHIGYTYWNHPPMNTMPTVSYVQLEKPAELGYLLEQGEPPRWGWLNVPGDWSFSTGLPLFDPINDQSYYIEIINKGLEKLSYTIKAKSDWINLSKENGIIQFDEKIEVTINWEKAPKGNVLGEIEISGTGQSYMVKVPIRNSPIDAVGFIENNGVVSIEAANFSHKHDAENVRWQVIPNLGRTHSSITPLPMDANPQQIDETAARVEYEFTLFEGSDLKIETYLSPTQNYQKNEGLEFAIAIDDEMPQIININENEIKPDWEYADWWQQSVGDHIKKKISLHNGIKAGAHKLKVWVIDPGVVIQKFVIDAGGLKPSYLGPPESKYVEK